MLYHRRRTARTKTLPQPSEYTSNDMQREKTIVPRKKEKTAALLLSFICLLIACFPIRDYSMVGITDGCGIQQHLLYSFFHTGLIHAAINVWCLLGLIFIYDIRLHRMIVAYIVACCYPATWVAHLVHYQDKPTVGLSALLFFLLASISFEVGRKVYFQAWMLSSLTLGFFFSTITNPWVHLYAYTCGMAYAILNKPIRR